MVRRRVPHMKHAGKGIRMTGQHGNNSSEYVGDSKSTLRQCHAQQSEGWDIVSLEVPL
jgi:hypothetical protein